MPKPEPPDTLEKPDGVSLALNFVPLAVIGAGLALARATSDGWLPRGLVFMAWLYLAPPVIGRLILAIHGRPHGEFGLGTPAYRAWWWLTQLQMPFNRLPALEEVLRLVPGLYPAWIALWGGQLSPLAFVGPRVLITDRYAVRVERGAVLGFKSALAGHMVTRDAAGRYRITVAAPVVGAEAIVGGDAGLGPGATLRAGHLLPTGRRVAAFDTWPRQAALAEEAT
ncbi:MAG: hypothetical protein Q4G70_10175 [Pseudomonadota bacterium]|nr:hypothetical protein [Pseudomonadota bacterium]